MTSQREPDDFESLSRAPREDGALAALVRRINASKTYELKAQVGDRLEVELYKGDEESRTIVEQTRDGERVVEFLYEEGIKPMILRIQKLGRSNRGLMIDLSTYTTEEIHCLRDAIVRVCELVEPTTTQADQQAKAKMRDEGIPNARLYRPVPTIRDRDGKVEVYVEGLHE